MRIPTATWLTAALQRFRAATPGSPRAQIDALISALRPLVDAEERYRRRRAAASSRARQLEMRERRRRAGLCRVCGGPIDEFAEAATDAPRGRGRPRTGYACSKCLAASRERSAAPIGPQGNTETSDHAPHEAPDDS